MKVIIEEKERANQHFIFGQVYKVKRDSDKKEMLLFKHLNTFMTIEANGEFDVYGDQKLEYYTILEEVTARVTITVGLK